jgi:hypothetical protein
MKSGDPAGGDVSGASAKSGGGRRGGRIGPDGITAPPTRHRLSEQCRVVRRFFLLALAGREVDKGTESLISPMLGVGEVVYGAAWWRLIVRVSVRLRVRRVGLHSVPRCLDQEAFPSEILSRVGLASTHSDHEGRELFLQFPPPRVNGFAAPGAQWRAAVICGN